MHAADPSKQVCPGMSNDKRQLAATPCRSRSGEVVCMQMNARRKTAQLHINILLGCLMHDGVYQDHNEEMVQTEALFDRLLWKLAEKVHRIRDHHHGLGCVRQPRSSHSHQRASPSMQKYSSQYIYFETNRRLHISNSPNQLSNPSMRRFVKLSLRDKMVEHGMRIHSKDIRSRTPLHMSERTMENLLVQLVTAWCKETRTPQQIVTAWEMILREVPIADSMDAMREPPHMILLGPSEEDVPAIPFNHDVIEPADEASDDERKLEAGVAPEPPAAPEALVAPVAPATPQSAPPATLPSKSERRARQAADREERAAQRNALLQDSDKYDNNDPFTDLCAQVDVNYSKS